LVTSLADFAETLRPHAARLDTDAEFLYTTYLLWQESGLHVTDFDKDLATLSRVIGAFVFLILQETVSGEPGCGVAYGHLRVGKGPLYDAGRVNGIIPWLTGIHIFNRVLLGFLLPNGSEAYARVPIEDCRTFRHTLPMSLIACSSMQTVGVTVANLPLSASDFVRIDPPGTAAKNNLNSLAGHTPLLFGNIQASLRIIQASPTLSDTAKLLSQNAHTTLEAARSIIATPEEGATFRARVADTAIRLATLATMASGGSSLQTGSDPERLYREALVFTLMAQTDFVVENAFQTVLGDN
jgi:hypothetical protein